MLDSTGNNTSYTISILLTLFLLSVVSRSGKDETSKSLTPEETRAEIIKMWEDFNKALPRHKAKQIGALYARYSSKYQNSILDQVREALEAALENSIHVPFENIFFDLAISGRKSRRPGLQDLERCISQKKTQVLLVFTTNRLYRKARKALGFIEWAVDEMNVRCIFVRNYIDSGKNERWKRYLQFLCLFDEFASEMYVENIRAAHIGKLLQRLVHGTLAYGYTGEIVAGSTNRNGKPIKKIVIESKTAQIVKQIFEWFTVDLLSMNSILKRLNADPEIPPPPKSADGRWRRLGLTTLLGNKRYTGDWGYGNTKAVLLSSKDYVRQVKRDTPLKEVHYEELRIIPDSVFHAAQKRLEEQAKDQSVKGRKPRDGDQKSRPKILNGLFRCPKHDRPLQVSGKNGQYMTCPDCRNEPPKMRALYSQLKRTLALQLICGKLAELIRSDQEMVNRLIMACQEEADRIQRPDPSQIEKLKKHHDKLVRSVKLLARQDPETDEEEQLLESALREKRIELADINSQLTTLTGLDSTKIKIPTPEEVTSLVNGLSQSLIEIEESGTQEEIDFLRELLTRLTGGQIKLVQMGEKRPRKGWLQGRFQCPLKAVLVQQLTGVPTIASNDYQEVVVDFKDPEPDEEKLKLAWELKQQGKMNIEMISALKCSPGNVTRLLKKASEIHGVPFEDGRKRRAKLKKKQLKTPQYRQIADEAVRLWNETPCYLKIADELDCSDVTVEKAIRFWYESRNLPVPTKSVIRAQKQEEARKLLDRKVPLNVVANSLHVNPATIRNWMKKQYEAEGKTMPDLRSRRNQPPDDSESNA